MITDSDLARYVADPHSFRREQIVLPNGRLYGDCEEPWQRDIHKAIDAKGESGNPKNKVIYIELSRGHAKTAMSAMTTCTAGLLEDNLEIVFFAGDAEQAGIGLTMMTNMIQANPDIEQSFRRMKDRIEVPSTGTVIKVMASDAATAFGIGGTAKGLRVVVDEFWAWKNQLLWEAIIS